MASDAGVPNKTYPWELVVLAAWLLVSVGGAVVTIVALVAYLFS